MIKLHREFENKKQILPALFDTTCYACDGYKTDLFYDNNLDEYLCCDCKEESEGLTEN